jgi:hypothetical protein
VVLNELAHSVLCVYSSNCSPEPAAPDLRKEFNWRNYNVSDSKYSCGKDEGVEVRAKEAKGIRTGGPEKVVNDGKKVRL